METKLVGVGQLKAGDVVRAHGGRFLVTEQPRSSEAHAPKGWVGSHEGYVRLQGPSDCAYTVARCIEGSVPGYFAPGSDWTLQGRVGLVAYAVEC